MLLCYPAIRSAMKVYVVEGRASRWAELLVPELREVAAFTVILVFVVGRWWQKCQRGFLPWASPTPLTENLQTNRSLASSDDTSAHFVLIEGDTGTVHLWGILRASQCKS